jgi:hypothetical protein
MKQKGNEPFDRLETLDALGAIKAWLSGDFDHAAEHILMLAIRRDTDIDLSDCEIKEILYEAVEDELEPMEILHQLLRADSGSEGMSPSSIKPR